MRTIVVWFGLLLWAVSCSDRRPDDPLKAFDRVREVSWELDRGLPADSLGNPEFLHAAGGRLIFVEPNADRMLQIYDPASGAVVRMQPRGNGGNELANIHQIGTFPSDSGDAFYLFDLFTRKIFIYRLSDGAFVLTDKRQAPESINTFSFLSSDRMFGCTSEGSRYARFDTTGRTDCRLGDYKAFGLTIPVGSGLLQGLSLAVPSPEGGERYAWFSFYGAGFQIVESAPDSCRIIADVLYKLPVFEVHTTPSNVEYSTFRQQTEIGYPAVTTDGTYIYALYNGHTLAEIIVNRDLAWRSRHVCVYDWEGRPVLLLNSDCDLRTLAYDEVSGRLYALGMTPEGMYELRYLETAALPGIQTGN